MIRSAREGIPDRAVNIHASAVALEGRAVLVTGPAGAGKTHLALALLAAWTGSGRLVADDQVFIVEDAGTLVAHTPRAIAGLIELRGIGIVERPYQSRVPVRLVVRLDERAPAAEALSGIRLEGVELPLLVLPARRSRDALAPIAAALEAIGFARAAANGPTLLARDNDLGLPSSEGRTT